MPAFLKTIDLLTAARAEYERRRRAWIAARDKAATQDDRARAIRTANADLLNWQDIVVFIEQDVTPDDSRPMARSTRATFERAKEVGVANDKLVELLAITRRVEEHVFYRHKLTWNPMRQAWSDQPERLAA